MVNQIFLMQTFENKYKNKKLRETNSEMKKKEKKKKKNL